MEVAVTFGAVGDILAICLIVKDIIGALDDSRGSPKDYRDLVAQLHTFDSTITQIAQALASLRSVSSIDGVRPLIVQALGQAQRCLRDFQEQTNKYAASLSSSATASQWKRPWKKIQWRLDEQNVQKFRADMSAHAISLGVLLGVVQVLASQHRDEIITKALSHLGTQTREVSTALLTSERRRGHMEMQIVEMMNDLSQSHEEAAISSRQILSAVLTTSESLNDVRNFLNPVTRPMTEAYFTVKDHSGYCFPVPFRTITSWRAFEDILGSIFGFPLDKLSKIEGIFYFGQLSCMPATKTLIDTNQPWEHAMARLQWVELTRMCCWTVYGLCYLGILGNSDNFTPDQKFGIRKLYNDERTERLKPLWTDSRPTNHATYLISLTSLIA